MATFTGFTGADMTVPVLRPTVDVRVAGCDLRRGDVLYWPDGRQIRVVRICPYDGHPVPGGADLRWVVGADGDRVAVDAEWPYDVRRSAEQGGTR